MQQQETVSASSKGSNMNMESNQDFLAMKLHEFFNKLVKNMCCVVRFIARKLFNSLFI